MSSTSETNGPVLGVAESLLLATVLVAAFLSIPGWVMHYLPARAIYNRLGANGYGTLYDGISVLMPLLLCLAAPVRSGLVLGQWRGQTLKIVGICALPIVLTGIIYPLTSRPFSGERIGVWLVSPLAQDLLFAGYLYGVFATTFAGVVHPRVRIGRAVLVTAVFFGFMHVPNFGDMTASYVAFQLLYTSVGSAWMLLARQLTGSVLPGVMTHMAVNCIAWL